MEWKRTFSRERYEPNKYTVTLSIRKTYLLIDFEIASARNTFEITGELIFGELVELLAFLRENFKE